MNEARITLEWDFHDKTERNTFDLTKSIAIGRHSESHIMLNDLSVSRFHGEIGVHAGHIELRNASQSKLIVILGKVAPHPIGFDERIQLGKGMKFKIEDATFTVINCTVNGHTMPEQAELKILRNCPQCGQALATDAEECPYDGWLPTSASTLYMNVKDLQNHSS